MTVLFSALLTTSAYAKGWTGTLVDATCKTNNQKEACPITKNTTHFGIVSGRRFLEFGEEGDLKVVSALIGKEKAMGKYPEGSAVKVWVDGKRKGNMLNLQVIDVK